MGKDPVPYDGTIRLVGHRVREVQPGVVKVEAQIRCEGRTFVGHRVREVQPGVVKVEAQIRCEGRTFDGAASTCPP